MNFSGNRQPRQVAGAMKTNYVFFQLLAGWLDSWMAADKPSSLFNPTRNTQHVLPISTQSSELSPSHILPRSDTPHLPPSKPASSPPTAHNLPALDYNRILETE